MATTERWMVVCDDERRRFRTRAAARDWARGENAHPSNVDVRRFGPYRNVDGVARILDLWSEDPDEEREG